MGKYASGTSMKTVIKSEVNEVKKILDKSSMQKDDKKAVMDALKEMAYQWCASNASACAFEETVKANVSEDVYTHLIRETLHSGLNEKKMSETWPFS